MWGSFFEYFSRAMMRSPGKGIAFALALLIAGIVSIPKIQIADNVQALLSGSHPTIATQLTALSEFASVDQLLFQIHGAPPPDLLAAANDLEKNFRKSPLFAEARYQTDLSEVTTFLDSVAPYRLLLDPRSPEEILGTLKPLLEETKARLLSPQAVLQKSILVEDPINSYGAILKQFESSPGLNKLDPSSGTFWSQDGTSILLMVKPTAPAFSSAGSQETMAAVNEVLATTRTAYPEVRYGIIGAPRFTSDAVAMIQNDIHFGAGLTLLIIFLIFLGAFRRPRLLLLALPPIVFGFSAAAIAASLWPSPIHSIVLAFIGATLGISVDYTLHLVNSVGSQSTPLSAAIPTTFNQLGKSLWVAALTTAIGLGALCFSHVEALAQMGFLALVAILGSFFGNLIWIPILLPRLVPDRLDTAPGLTVIGLLPRIGRRFPKATLLIIMVVCGICSLASQGVLIDGDLRNLDTHSPQAIEEENRFFNTFGDPSRIAMVLIEASTLEEALTKSFQATAILRENNVTKIMTPSLFAPPTSLIEKRRSQWCAIKNFPQALDAQAATLGFRNGAFANFASHFEKMCSLQSPPYDPAPLIKSLEALLGRQFTSSITGAIRIPIIIESPKAGSTDLQRRLTELGQTSLVSRPSLNQTLINLIGEDLPKLGGIALGLIFLLLLLFYRNPADALIPLSPCLGGILFTLAFLGITQTPINLLNLCVFPLLLGLGIDYGVLMKDAANDHERTERAISVVIAAATTLAGFGTLALADYYAIKTIGQAVLLAVTSCASVALVLPSALNYFRESN